MHWAFNHLFCLFLANKLYNPVGVTELLEQSIIVNISTGDINEKNWLFQGSWETEGGIDVVAVKQTRLYIYMYKSWVILIWVITGQERSLHWSFRTAKIIAQKVLQHLLDTLHFLSTSLFPSRKRNFWEYILVVLWINWNGWVTSKIAVQQQSTVCWSLL